MVTISQMEDYHVNCDLAISNDVLQSTEVLLCLLDVKIYILPAPWILPYQISWSHWFPHCYWRSLQIMSWGLSNQCHPIQQSLVFSEWDVFLESIQIKWRHMFVIVKVILCLIDSWCHVCNIPLVSRVNQHSSQAILMLRWYLVPTGYNSGKLINMLLLYVYLFWQQVDHA